MGIVNIFDRNDAVVGELHLGGQGDFSYRDRGNDALDGIVRGALNAGIPRMASHYDDKSDTVRHHMEIVTKDQDHFLESLTMVLGKNGFRVSYGGAADDEEIRSLLDDFEQGNADKEEILTRLERMTQLEKSLLVSELRQIKSEYTKEK